MNNTNYSQKILLTLVGAIALSATVSHPLRAQTNSEARGEYQKNEQDTMGGGIFGEGFNPMNLIHNANLSRSRGPDQFRQDAGNQLESAAEKFKRLQRERLEGSQSADQVADEVAPEN